MIYRLPKDSLEDAMSENQIIFGWIGLREGCTETEVSVVKIHQEFSACVCVRFNEGDEHPALKNLKNKCTDCCFVLRKEQVMWEKVKPTESEIKANMMYTKDTRKNANQPAGPPSVQTRSQKRKGM